jgi:hypothetical protein
MIIASRFLKDKTSCTNANRVAKSLNLNKDLNNNLNPKELMDLIK